MEEDGTGLSSLVDVLQFVVDWIRVGTLLAVVLLNVYLVWTDVQARKRRANSTTRTTQEEPEELDSKQPNGAVPALLVIGQ